MFPARFNNKTNGVTPRRWLLLANPDLAALLTEAVGEGWVTDLDRLRVAPRPCRRRGLPRPVPRRPSRPPSRGSPRGSSGEHGISLDEQSIFDSQVKRIHEYKRQLLNVLHIMMLYDRLRSDSTLRPAAADVPLRGQGRARLSAGQADHQADQRRGRGDRPTTRRCAGRLQGGLPAQLQRHPGRTAHPGQRRLRADLDRRLRGQRHEQHEVHDERGAHHRHPRRRHDRDRPRRSARRTSSSSA